MLCRPCQPKYRPSQLGTVVLVVVRKRIDDKPAFEPFVSEAIPPRQRRSLAKQDAVAPKTPLQTAHRCCHIVFLVYLLCPLYRPSIYASLGGSRMEFLTRDNDGDDHGGLARLSFCQSWSKSSITVEKTESSPKFQIIAVEQ